MARPTGLAIPSSFLRLEARTRGAVFTPSEVEDTLGGGPTAYAELARLTDLGWLVRLARGRYATMDAIVRLTAGAEVGLDPFRSKCFYAILHRAVGSAIRVLTGRLDGIILYGSAARGELGPESDLDLMLVVDEVPVSAFEEVRQTGPIGRSVGALIVEEWERAGHYHAVQVVEATPRAFERPGDLMLGVAEDGRILFDPRGRVGTSLRRLRARYRRHRVRRRRLAAGDYYWELGTSDGSRA